MSQNQIVISNRDYETLLKALGYPIAGCFFIDSSRPAADACSAVGGATNLPGSANPTAYDIWFCRLPTTAGDADTATLQSNMAAVGGVSTYKCFTHAPVNSSATPRRSLSSLTGLTLALPLLAVALPALLM